MQFSVGDKVKVIDEAVSGIVTRLGKKKIYIDSDGFEFEYSPAKLVVVTQSDRQLLEDYLAHTDGRISTKLDDIKLPKPISREERIEELGSVSGRRNSKGILEFDLHIHDLLVSHSHMMPGEMLQYQLDYTVNCLEESIRKREPRIVFIHGVGKGVLKTEVHKIIQSYELPYHDASRKEYGTGATEVELLAGR
ncbi:Smr/MutS family protein [bacterium SCSIO 12741]|nr:Smr/MutS family protein [bacterium SCSIO 12741]